MKKFEELRKSMKPSSKAKSKKLARAYNREIRRTMTASGASQGHNSTCELTKRLEHPENYGNEPVFCTCGAGGILKGARK